MNFKIYKVFSLEYTPLLAGAIEYTNCTCRKIRLNSPHPTNEYLGYDTKMHLMVRFQFWSLGECRGIHEIT